ncbi:MAG: hypothetical protein Hals2KO_27870 [Halioglobus sp.]
MKHTALRKLTYGSLMLGLIAATPALAGEQVATDNPEAAQSEIVSDSKAMARDAWRAGKLESAYLLNRHLNNFSIDPDVQGDTVLLTGKVNSSVEKELAGQIALGIDGIQSVDNRLTVVNGEKLEPSSDSFSSKVADATLAAEVKIDLLANSETSGLDINVDVAEARVILRGDVDSAEEKDLAERIASNVDGVASVENKLKVASS